MDTMMRSRSKHVWAAIAGVVAVFATGSAQAAEPLRFCADPANLPFSSDDPKSPGLYGEIAQAVGAALGRPVTYVWAPTYVGRRTIRTTLLAGKCDAMIGLPADPDFMGPKVIFSKPFATIGYALVAPKDTPARSLADLAGKRVGVQLSTTPQSVLASTDGLEMVSYREPEDVMEALAAGQVQAAFVWEPVAGYLNKTRMHDAFVIVPVSGHGLRFPTAIGFARNEEPLRAEVDGVLDGLAGKIAEAEARYGLPSGLPVKLGDAGTTERMQVATAEPQTATDATTAPAAAPPAAPAPSPPSAGGEQAADAIAAGHELFNGTCAHCHGPDAVTNERKINLRLLSRRYKDKMEETFDATVRNGRPEKGMPSWTGVFTDEQFAQILTYLRTVQTP